MATPVIVAIDSSTSACKAVVFDLSGATVAETRHHLQQSSPRPGWSEQAAEQWVDGALTALAAVTDLLAPHHHPVGLAITHQRESFVCLDEAGRPLRPAILWNDRRCRAQAEELGTAAIRHRTGKPPSTVPSLYKLRWLAEHEPQVLASTGLVADVHSFLALLLTGRAVAARSSADALGLLNLDTGDWDPDLVTECGLVPGQLPEIAAAGTRIGSLTAEAARRTGLPEGLPVIAGGGDGQCAGLGVGAWSAGAGYLNLGTSVSLGAFTTRRGVYPGARTMVAHQPGLFAVETLQVSGAASLTWFAESFGMDDALVAAAAQVPPGCEGLRFVPYLSGRQTPCWDPDASGGFSGLRPEHRRPQLYRAVLEGLALDQRMCLAYLRSEAGIRIDRVILTGGVGQSNLATRIFAAALDIPVSLSRERECTALGAAILAAPACDSRYATVAEAAAGMVGSTEPVEVDAAVAEAYRLLPDPA